MIPRILRAGLDDWETVQQLTEMVRKAAEEGLVLMKVWVSGGGRTREEEHKKSPEDWAIVHNQNTIEAEPKLGKRERKDGLKMQFKVPLRCWHVAVNVTT